MLVKHYPSWLPGGGFKKTAEQYERNIRRIRDLPYYFVTRQMENKKHGPSFVSNSLEKEPVQPGSEAEMVLKWSAVSLYAGGADAVSALESALQFHNHHTLSILHTHMERGDTDK